MQRGKIFIRKQFYTVSCCGIRGGCNFAEIWFSDIFVYLKKTQGIYISVYILVFGVGWDMPLTRRTRLSGSSIVITLPSQLVEAYGICEGDELEIIPLGFGEFKIRKISGMDDEVGER